MSSGSGIIVGQSGSGFGGAGLETAFGGGASLPHQGVTTATGHTSELEDPPGLYEKVRINTHCVHTCNIHACTCTCTPGFTCACMCAYGGGEVYVYTCLS